MFLIMEQSLMAVNKGVGKDSGFGMSRMEINIGKVCLILMIY